MKPKNKTNALNNSKRHAKKSAKMNKNKLNDANNEKTCTSRNESVTQRNEHRPLRGNWPKWTAEMTASHGG